ncbi:MAG: hypothetical protein IPN07_00600 [Dehalococcoidia bacterium]|nr:hypothetical protein [Dehalococcoidia bacterium]
MRPQNDATPSEVLALMRPGQFSRLTLLVALLPLGSLLFACGGGDKKVALDDWVADLCDAAADYQEASDKAGEGFLEADFEDTKKAKEAFAESLKDQKEAQSDFRSAFGKIGQPDIEDGDKVIDAFKEQFDENDKLTKDIEKAIKAIDDDDDFLEEFLKVADEFDTPDFREKLDDLAEDSDDVQDLIDEIDDDEACSEAIFDDDSADSTSNTATPTPTKSTQAGRTATTTSKTPAATKTVAPATTTNEKWVSGICVSFTGWVNDIDQANGEFQTALDKSTGDGASIKRLLVDFLKKGQTETKNLQKEVSALKAPDVTDGAKIHKVFVDVSTELVKVFDTLVADANKISTTNPSQTLADVERLSAGIADAFDEASAGFDKLDDFNAPQIESIFSSRPECSGF